MKHPWSTSISPVSLLFLSLFVFVSAQSRCPRVPSLPQVVGVRTTGGEDGQTAKITVNVRSTVRVQLQWYKSVPVEQAYNYTARYRIPIKDENDAMFKITTTNQSSSYQTSLEIQQPNLAIDFSLYHLTMNVTDDCFECQWTVTPPSGGADGAGIAMPRLIAMEKRSRTSQRNKALELVLRPVIPRQVMNAIRSGRHDEQILFLDITAWKQHFKRNGTDLDWFGPNAVPDEIRYVLRYGGYPTGSYVSIRPMRVTTPGLYKVTFTQMFMGMRLELVVTTEISEGSDVNEGVPPSVGLRTCAVYSWRDSTFGDVIPLRRGQQNCLMCVASSETPHQLTFVKQRIQSGGVAGHVRLPVEKQQHMGKTYSSLRYNVNNALALDAGWYVCGATNQHGTTTRTFRVDVIEPVKMLSIEPNAVVLQGDGQEITVKCSASGTAGLNITFYKMDINLFSRFQNEPITTLEYRGLQLDSSYGNPPANRVTRTRNGTTITGELKHRVSPLSDYRQGQKFACVASNRFGDFRIGLADIFKLAAPSF